MLFESLSWMEEEEHSVDVPRAASAADFRDAPGDGSFGGPCQASDEVMDRILAAAVDGIAEALRGL
jgi:creatinine amidohydrolase/Fe(II)-dependent formamide hydrolase-like protein